MLVSRTTGNLFLIESHLVTTINQNDVPSCPATGCLAVWGAFYKIDNTQGNSSFLDQLAPYINTTDAVREHGPTRRRRGWRC